MIDVAIAYNRFKFIGNEFLTWLWYIVDTSQSEIRRVDDNATSLVVGNRMVLENHLHDTIERITINGDDAGLEEGRLSLRKGAVVVEMNMVLISENQEWAFSLKGESISFSGLKVPSTGSAETNEDIEGMVLEKIYLYEKITNLLNSLFNRFLELRTSMVWAQQIVPDMQQWIRE